jgi:polyadenylate-binding protein
MVQGLPASATEDFLEQLFSEVRPVHRPGGVVVKRKTDRRGQPVTYAFVTFDSRQDVDHVINELNYTKLDGAPIRIIHADPETRNIVRSGKGNLFVKNLDPTIEDSQLHDAFANFGDILSCKIAIDERGVSRGYGYVQFRREEDANQARIDLKEASINGRPLTIEPFQRRIRQSEEETFTNVYIKNLPDSVKTHDDLAALFSKFGVVTSAKLQIQEAGNGPSTSFGYCNFADHESAVRSIKELDGFELDGKTLLCTRHKTRAERVRDLRRQTDLWRQQNYEVYKGRNLYVRGFDETTTEDDLRAFFREFGEIESLKIQTDETGVSKKFGFVCFRSAEDAQKCLSESTLMKFPKLDKQVYLQEHIPVNRRRQQNIQNNNKGGAPAGGSGGGGPREVGGGGGGGKGVQPQVAQPVFPQVVAGAQYVPPQLPQAFFAQPLQGFGEISPFITQASPRDRIKQEIMETVPQGQHQQLFTRLRDLSDDQVARLTRDQNLLRQWFAQV